MSLNIKFLIFFLLPSLCFASAPSRVATYTSQTTIRAADVTSNENVIFSYLQSGVDSFADGSIIGADIANSAAISYSKLNLMSGIVNSDVSASAAVTYSKLNLSNSIVNADLSSSAAIADSKLATIATAGKVSGAALTSLSSTPSGAGVLPIANLATGTPSGSKFIRDDGTLQTPAGTFTGLKFVSSSAFTNSITLDPTKSYLIRTIVSLTTAGTIITATFNSDTTGGNYTGVNSNTTISAGVRLIGTVAVNSNSSEGAYYDTYVYPQSADTTKKVWLRGNFLGATDSGNKDLTYSAVWSGTATLSSMQFSNGTGTVTATNYLYEIQQS